MASKAPPIPFYTLRGHKTEVTALCFIQEDGNICLTNTKHVALISGSNSGEIFHWDLKTNRTSFRLVGHDNKRILWLHYDKSNIFSQGRDGYIIVWGKSDDSWCTIKKFPSNDIGFCSATFYARNCETFLLAPMANDTLAKIDVEKDVPPTNIKMSSHIMCIKVIVRKSVTLVFCGLEDGSIALWDLDKSVELSSLVFHKEPVFCIDVDLDLKNCGVSGSPENYLQTWQISSEFQLSEGKRIPLTNKGVNSAVIRPDRKILMTGGWDGNIRVFSWKTLKPLAVLKFHESSINCLSCSIDSVGKYNSVFASGSNDTNIALWSIY